MAKHLATPTTTPTQVAHPWRAALRTFVAAAVGVTLAWLVRTLGIDLTGMSEPIIDSLTAAAWAAGTGFVQWLLTRPRLLPFFEVVGLGTGFETEPAPLTPAVAMSRRAAGGPDA